MDQGRKTFEGLYLSLIALSLHGFDSNHAISFGGVSSEDLAKSSLAKNTVWIEIEVIGEFDPGEKFTLIDFCHRGEIIR